MDINHQNLKKFQKIVNKYQVETELPTLNNWKEKSNNELWLWLVGQVMVVGGVGGNERFIQRKDLQKQISYFSLKQYINDAELQFIMSLGINRNTLALDIRIQNIFKFFGIEFPTQTQLSSKTIYDATEKEIIQKICNPLNIAPVIFDRILFQNYKSIIKNKLL